MKSLYEVTGNILDFNTVLVNRATLREVPEQMWDRFIAVYSEKMGVPVKNLIGGADGFKKLFIEAQEEV